MLEIVNRGRKVLFGNGTISEPVDVAVDRGKSGSGIGRNPNQRHDDMALWPRLNAFGGHIMQTDNMLSRKRQERTFRLADLGHEPYPWDGVWGPISMALHCICQVYRFLILAISSAMYDISGDSRLKQVRSHAVRTSFLRVLSSCSLFPSHWAASSWYS